MQQVGESNGFVSRFTLGEGDLCFAVKDTMDVTGYRTQAGCQALAATPVARQHAQVVETLLHKQCRLIGKTTLHELAFGVTGINAWAGTAMNPCYPALIPGGSSSGSAVVAAAGAADFALGTDTGGSVRMPAACCGILGLKTTFGAISRAGVMPASSSLDCVGVFAREPAVLRQVLERLSVPVGEPLGRLPAVGFLSVATAEIDALLLSQLELAGIQPTAVTLAALADAHQAGLGIINHENWHAFHSLLAGGGVSADVASRIRAGQHVDAAQLDHAEQTRRQFCDQVDALLTQTPLLALATLPELPPTLLEAEDPLSVVNLTRLVRPFNLSGHPAIALPVGEIAGRPVSLQLIAGRGQDGLLVQAAEWLVQRRRH